MVAFDQDSRIYVYDGRNLRVSLFDSNGEFMRSFIIGLTSHRWAVEAKGSVYIFVSSSTDSTVCKFDSTGKLLTKFCSQSNRFFLRASYSGGGLAFDGNSFVYQASPFEYLINKFDMNGRLLDTFGKAFFSVSPTEGSAGDGRSKQGNDVVFAMDSDIQLAVFG